jgi:hypothetical protein
MNNTIKFAMEASLRQINTGYLTKAEIRRIIKDKRKDYIQTHTNQINRHWFNKQIDQILK